MNLKYNLYVCTCNYDSGGLETVSRFGSKECILHFKAGIQEQDVHNYVAYHERAVQEV